jgi:hypothetical protein
MDLSGETGNSKDNINIISNIFMKACISIVDFKLVV